MMNKLFIVFISLALLAVWVAEAWAHGPGGFRSGTRSDGYSQPGFNRPSFKNSGSGLHKFYRHPRSFRGTGTGTGYGHGRPYRGRFYGHHRQANQRLPIIENGVLYSKPGPLQNRFSFDPLIRSHNHGIGVSPLRKGLAKKARKRTPRHLQPFNPQDPWFLYGKGDLLRRMGIIQK